MSFGATPGTHLQHLLLDSRAVATKDQKVACLKTLRVVVKNLADPQKNADPKYRQLKLSNEKVRAKLAPCPSGVEYLKAIGFVSVVDVDGEEECLRIPPERTVSVSDMEASLVELNNALAMIAPPSRPREPFAEEKKTPEGILVRERPSGSTVSAGSGGGAAGKLSEKQKARLLMEKKREREAEEAREARRKTSHLIKQDKYVRENDANWTSQQSAACVKSGSGINTFRDKYGE